MKGRKEGSKTNTETKMITNKNKDVEVQAAQKKKKKKGKEEGNYKEYGHEGRCPGSKERKIERKKINTKENITIIDIKEEAQAAVKERKKERRKKKGKKNNTKIQRI